VPHQVWFWPDGALGASGLIYGKRYKDMIKNSADNKKKSEKQRWYVVLGVSTAAFLVFGGLLGLELFLGWQSQSYYAALVDGIETRTRAPSNPVPMPTVPPMLSPGEEDGGNGAYCSDCGIDCQLTSDKAGVFSDRCVRERFEEPAYDEEEWVPYVDFEALGEEFPGIVGWIRLEGSLIDYPLMQWTDNDYFLRHLPDGTRHRSGSIFLDFRNSQDFSDINTLLYGHETSTEDMFGALKNYRRQEFYDSNTFMQIYTPQGDYQLAIFAAYLVDSGHESPPLSFLDDEAFASHIADIRQRSFFTSGVEVDAGDRIVSLCTCAYDFANARLVVVGKLMNY